MYIYHSNQIWQKFNQVQYKRYATQQIMISCAPDIWLTLFSVQHDYTVVILVFGINTVFWGSWYIAITLIDRVMSAVNRALRLFGWYVYKIHIDYNRILNVDYTKSYPWGWHYSDVTMGTITSQIISLTIVYSTINSDAGQRKHQSSTSLAFVWGIHRAPVNSRTNGQ